ncbi:hypothetical protein [Sulfurisphaera ohwakuensis]|uniref:Uncharacterized protein n=1 Tax=Sulfurisphaera ohwakuensis TaxID=69656 RepID=A0A650CK36_SULOH|nr:hypothetical protein [Sulfurisphaera ohwakuensis]MBB5255211.1 hypothetical protein [Sulfurisphaera ohwakuensis]QGR18231.1 hypothetical protein D1869_14320 [Sulfurisphaera ohwakuensis]
MKKLFVIIGSILSGLGIWLKSIDKSFSLTKVIENGKVIEIYLTPETNEVVKPSKSSNGVLNLSVSVSHPIILYQSQPVPSTNVTCVTVTSTAVQPPWYANLWPEVLTIGIIMLGIAIFSWIKLKGLRK